MDYKEKYEQALKWMQSLYGGLHGVTKEEAEKYFPELKKSEDEKMRESIIYALQNGGFYSSDKTDEAIAWLEKQGEQHPHVDVNKMVDKFAHTEVKGYGVPSMIEVDAYRRGIEDAFEKQGIQPTDKVEPKFKVGDWLQYRYAEPFLVEEITEQGYCNNSCLPFEWEDEIHLWTIQDAKDGDVLVDVYGNIGIYKSHDDFDWTSYCSLGCDGGFQNFKVEHENENTHPATQEQRDLLFQKMNETRYE